MKQKKKQLWAEARRRCGLSEEEVRMAKELGFQPKSLIKNIPAPSQTWKAPVNQWVRSLWEEKIGSKRANQPVSLAEVAAPESPETGAAGEDGAPPESRARARVIEFRNPDDPWPDRPEIPDLPPLDFYEDMENFDRWEWERHRRPSEDRIDEQNGFHLRRQRLFRWAAQSIAVAFSEMPDTARVAAFGSVAKPLRIHLPRFPEFRRHGIELWHECGDLDLAVWMSGFDRLRSLKTALHKGLSWTQETPSGGVAHHQVDVHLFDAADGEYRGRLCIFGQCPKPGKRECRVPGCGAHLFLQQFAGYRFQQARFEAEPEVLLFDRESGFLVHMPRIEGKVREVKYTPREQDYGEEDALDFPDGPHLFTDITDEDVPF